MTLLEWIQIITIIANLIAICMNVKNLIRTNKIARELKTRLEILNND